MRRRVLAGMLMLITGCVVFGICVAQIVATLALGPQYIAPPAPRPAAVTTGVSHTTAPTVTAADDAPATGARCVAACQPVGTPLAPPVNTYRTAADSSIVSPRT